MIRLSQLIRSLLSPSRRPGVDRSSAALMDEALLATVEDLVAAKRVYRTAAMLVGTDGTASRADCDRVWQLIARLARHVEADPRATAARCPHLVLERGGLTRACPMWAHGRRVR